MTKEDFICGSLAWLFLIAAICFVWYQVSLPPEQSAFYIPSPKGVVVYKCRQCDFVTSERLNINQCPKCGNKGTAKIHWYIQHVLD